MLSARLLAQRAVLVDFFWRTITVLLIGGLFLYAISPFVLRGPARRTVIFYGFSILGDVMQKGIFPAFRDQWKARTGEDLEFITSFAGSGTVTNQIVMGVPAELALLSLELDAERVANAGATPAGSWLRLPVHGVVNRTPFIFLVRPGNPLNIRDWTDLERPGVGIVHPDPLTSGGANWAIMAEYGSAALGASDPQQAGYDRLLGIWRNVVAQAASARAARTQFENGFGDVLITYEQEIVFDIQRGHLKGEAVYPRSTILSEHTLVVVDRNVAEDQRPVVSALTDFMWTEQAQRIFVQYGFRSVDERLDVENKNFGRVEQPFLISQFGGWNEAKRDVVDAIWRDRVLKQVGR